MSGQPFSVLPRRRAGELSSAVSGSLHGHDRLLRPADDAESTRTIHAALDAGVTLFDTADRYGLGKNEELLGRALESREATVATKFGIVPGDKPGERKLDGSPAYVERACEASLRRLGRSSIELFLLHRVDRGVPIEETVGAMGRLVEAGKVRQIGLCEVGAETLRRAQRTFPIATVQSEYSLWCREPEAEVLATCRELGVGFVAYWALGMGMLTGRVSRLDALGAQDLRVSMPRFQAEHLERNRELVAGLERIAAHAGCTPAQLSLAWLLARASFVVH